MSNEEVPAENANRGFSERLLDGIEKVGNKVPHPVLMFLYLIIIVIVLSAVMSLLDISVTEEIAVPVQATDPENAYYLDSTEPLASYPQEPYDVDYVIEERTIEVRSLLSVEGIRFIFTSFVGNFAGFSVVAVILVAMVGVGVAEESGLMSTLIRKIVKVTPRQFITFILILVGVLSSVATDAGYLILIPLGAVAFLSIGRHPLAGVAAAFGGVSAVFAVNILIAPVDGMLTEITNEAIALAGGEPITIVANFYFAAASTIVLSLVAAVVTTRIIEPRLGVYEGPAGDQGNDQEEGDSAAEGRGLRFALYASLFMTLLVLIFTLPPGAPLRDPETGAIIGNTPFMDSLIFIITLIFLLAGIGYGIGAGTFKSSDDVILGVNKNYAALAGLLFMLLMIAQFIAFFNYSNIPQVTAVWLADTLEQANIGAIPLLVGFILVIMMLNIIIPNVIPKWAIFAPIFIPVFFRLGVAPQTVLAAYRVGDSPTNVITPLMVYLPFVLTIVQRYQKDAGIGTVVALMLPYTLVIAVVWILFFILWIVLGIPLGPGFPVSF